MAEIGAGTGSSYPGALDANSTLEVNSPNAGKTKARAEVPNDLAAAIIAVQTELGTDPAGTLTDVKTFLQTQHNTNGTHKSIVTCFPFSGARVYNSANQSISANSTTELFWDSETYDTDAIHSTSSTTGRLTVPAGITYVEIFGQVLWAASAIGYRTATIMINGTYTGNGWAQDVRVASPSGSTSQPLSTGPVSVTAGDYFILAVWQNSGGALNVTNGGIGGSWFAMRVLR